MLNEIILQGRLTKQPEISSRQDSDRSIEWCNFTLAVPRDYKKKDANENENRPTDFFYCRVFGSSAEYLSKYGYKGGRVTVKGRMESGYYQNSEGTSVYYAQVRVDKLWVNDFGGNTPESGRPSYDPNEDPNHFVDVPDEAEVPFLQ